MQQLAFIPTRSRPGTDNRRIGGHRAAHAGKSFEQLILASQNDRLGPVCALIQIRNFAKRIPEKDKRFLQLGQRMKLIEEKSPCDFAGAVWESGISICFDAKSVGEDVASLRVNDPAIVKPHQIAALAALECAGAFAGFMVECRRHRDFRWLWASKAQSNQPIKWDDPRWHIFGSVEDGKPVPLRKLFSSYV